MSNQLSQSYGGNCTSSRLDLTSFIFYLLAMFIDVYCFQKNAIRYITCRWTSLTCPRAELTCGGGALHSAAVKGCDTTIKNHERHILPTSTAAVLLLQSLMTSMFSKFAILSKLYLRHNHTNNTACPQKVPEENEHESQAKSMMLTDAGPDVRIVLEIQLFSNFHNHTHIDLRYR